MRPLDRAEALDRDDVGIGHLTDRPYARPRRHAIDQDGAGAALLETAAEFCAVELEIVAQDVKQRGVRCGVDRMHDTVDLQVDGHSGSSNDRFRVTVLESAACGQVPPTFAAYCVAAMQPSRARSGYFCRGLMSPSAHSARVRARNSSNRPEMMAARAVSMSS